jgi:hypothetical protein
MADGEFNSTWNGVEPVRARTCVARLVERIAILEASLEQCRVLAEKGSPNTADQYCRQIEQAASAALDKAAV